MQFTLWINWPNQPGRSSLMEPYNVDGLDAAREEAADQVEQGFDHLAVEDSAEYIEAIHTLRAQAMSLTEEGGVVGPLPDGHVINVQPTQS